MKNLKILPAAISYSASKAYHDHEGDIIMICPTEEDALMRLKQVIFFDPNVYVLYLPGFDTIPFDRVSPSVQIMSQRSDVLHSLSSEKRRKVMLITSASNLLQKIPTNKEWNSSGFKITRGDVVSYDSLAKSLVNIGFARVMTAASPGEFAIRGEILDIVISESTGYRVNVAWGKIEDVKCFDPLTQVSTSNIEMIDIHSTSEFTLNEANITRFRENFLKIFNVNHAKHPLYNAIIEGRHFAASEHLMPLLYSEMISIIDYLKNPLIIMQSYVGNAINNMESDIADLYDRRIESNKNATSFYPALPPSMLYFKVSEVESLLAKNITIKVDSDNIQEDYYGAVPIPNFYHQSLQKQDVIFDLLYEFIQSKNQPITICCFSQSAIERISNIFNIHDISYSNIKFAIAPLQSGFSTKNQVFISQSDILGNKHLSTVRNSNKKLKTLLSEIENFTEGELVVHKDYGIGQFITIETLNIGNKPHDCVKIMYADNDRVYVPVENLDLIKRYGSEDGTLDKLGGVAWQKRRSKLKNRIGDLAQKLIQIAAQRELNKVDPIIADSLYDEFCNRFPYSETDDQLNAISDITEDFIKGYPMDRLICGDVGFGKTEVAMRAAYLAASNGKQVVIVVPTTILCRQHYNNFIDRFYNTKFKIAQISRLVTSAEVTRVKHALRDGEINIVVGTHAILSKDVGFYDLGLMIIDEEQHFGVTQKERMKELKHGIHVLSLSATPIPRTLQMSLLGIRDLSLIATPPIDRLAVRTSVIEYDSVIIRDALMKEHLRGGRSFYVCPRIKDIEEITKKLTSIVPELTYQVAHGQMPPSVIDQIMGDFYDGKFDILLSTTIIESGIDVPSANTMIIHKAEMLGLSQLYQLRGRIGRGKVRGYAYLTISSKGVTKHATQRLDILQNLDTLGAGFSIASHDMDIRGFGNLVGDEQSGHIKEVGAELYHDMLESAISALRSQQVESEDINPTINLGLSVSLPESYIHDNNLRMGLYKRIAILESEEQIEDFRDELIDRFGNLPEEVNNLLSVIYIKQLCKKLYIASIDAGPQGFVIKFQEGYDPLGVVMPFISKYPRHSKIRPDGKFIILKTLSEANIVLETKKILCELQ